MCIMGMAAHICMHVYGSSANTYVCMCVKMIVLMQKNCACVPNNSTWPAFYAVSILTGIGFTMSLFVGNLAFANDMQYIDGVKIGVLAGSLLSTIFGYFLLLIFSKK